MRSAALRPSNATIAAVRVHAAAAQQLCRSVRAVASAAGFVTQEGQGAEEKEKFTLVLTGGLLAEDGVITRLLREQLALTCPLAIPVHPKVRSPTCWGGLHRSGHVGGLCTLDRLTPYTHPPTSASAEVWLRADAGGAGGRGCLHRLQPHPRCIVRRMLLIRVVWEGDAPLHGASFNQA
jgi:hypothetical protein